MGSYHNQDAGLPFGYNESIEGVAFPPDYRPRGPPPAPQGKPLLNLSDQEELDGFFAGFESNLPSTEVPSSGPGVSPIDLAANNDPSFGPQYFITSHTHMQGQPPFVDPNALEGGIAGMFNGNHDVSNVLMGADNSPFYHLVQHAIQPSPLSNYQSQPNSGQHFLDPLSTSVTNNYSVSWTPSLQSNNINGSSSSRPLVRFGTDSHFQPTGYVPPLGTTDVGEQTGLQRLEWLEGDAQSSATNTQPNTQPNTVPSSPIWTRKRREEGFMSSSKDEPAGPKADMEPAHNDDHQESDGPTPHSQKKRKVTHKSRLSDHLPFAESPSSTSRNNPLTPSTTKTTTTAKPNNRSKRKPSNIEIPTSTRPSYPPDPSPSTSTNTTSFPTPKTVPQRHHNISSTSPSSSTFTPSHSHHNSYQNPNQSDNNNITTPTANNGSNGNNNNNSTRTPLTSHQKRLNHTNSEQRRRDQAQKAFARLFDLVPELQREGKMSQMKRLERVVRKIRDLEEGNRVLRQRIEERGGSGVSMVRRGEGEGEGDGGGGGVGVGVGVGAGAGGDDGDGDGDGDDEIEDQEEDRGG